AVREAAAVAVDGGAVHRADRGGGDLAGASRRLRGLAVAGGGAGDLAEVMGEEDAQRGGAAAKGVVIAGPRLEDVEGAPGGLEVAAVEARQPGGLEAERIAGGGGAALGDDLDGAGDLGRAIEEAPADEQPGVGAAT